MKAIETHYKGYRFRSRLEARWAVFFDALGIPWEYEPEGFDLEDGNLYLPDFYLPQQKCWIEIKGEIPEECGIEFDKAKKLSILSGKWVDMIIGTPGKHDVLGFRMGKDSLWCISEGICASCGSLGFMGYHHSVPPASMKTGLWWGHCYNCDGVVLPDRRGKLQHAIEAARSARFEHGEQG